MKKIITTLAVASVFLFTGCFTDSDTATVKINLGNIPIAKTAKAEKKSLIDRFLMIFAKEAVAQEVPEWTGVKVVHLGAFDANNKFLAKKRISVTPEGGDPVNTYVEFDVPARNEVRIVVLGAQEIGEDENSNPIYGAGYYGCSEPLNLTAGATEEVEVKMKEFEEILYGVGDIYKINFRYDTSHPVHDPNNHIVAIRWDRIYGVSRYILDYYNETVGDDTYINIHNDSNEICIMPSYAPNDLTYKITLEFNFAGIKSNPAEFTLSL